MNTTRLRFIAWLALLLVGCGRAPRGSEPATHEPRRIVTLLPSFTEIVFALGAGERVVGVDDFSDYPPEVARLPKLGGPYDPELERVLALHPDLVLLPSNSKVAAALSQIGIKIATAEPHRLAEALDVIELTGKLVGRKAEALALIDRMKRELAALQAKAAQARPVSVYYELDATPFSVGPDSFIGTLIQQAGGLNIVPAELGDFPQISPELVISKNPGVIIGAKLEDVRARPGWERIAAVQSGRVYTWSADEDHLLARPGPRLPQALKALIGKLHPELSP